jgi:hypothetical protein
VPVTSVNTAELVQTAAIVTASTSPVGSSPTRHSDEEQITHSSPINGHVSPQRSSPHEKIRQLIVPSSGAILTNGETTQTIVVTSGNSRSAEHTIIPTSNSSVLHHNDIHIKQEPLDNSLPPLASPATIVDVVAGGVDRNRELEPSPPTTVISLAPAQPYSPGTPQLTFATPTYDIATTGQYAVQV